MKMFEFKRMTMDEIQTNKPPGKKESGKVGI
jgi:hypothetical protein